MAQHILRVDASMRHTGSASRELADRLIARLTADGAATVTTRDLAVETIPFVDETMISGLYVPDQDRSPEQKQSLATSDRLVKELKDADTVVISVAMYNFAIPAALKAWIDQITRFGVTFRYTDSGAEGLLTGKKVYILLATGGTPVDSEIDFATGYLRHILGFNGLTDVTVVAADSLMRDATRKDAALDSVDQLDLAQAA